MILKNKNLVLCFVIALLALSTSQAKAQIAWETNLGSFAVFDGDPNGTTKLAVTSVGNLPTKNYTFGLTWDDPSSDDYATATDASLNFDNKTDDNIKINLTDTGWNLLEQEGTLSLGFSVNYTGTNDPGFQTLTGTINYDSADIITTETPFKLKPIGVMMSVINCYSLVPDADSSPMTYRLPSMPIRPMVQGRFKIAPEVITNFKVSFLKNLTANPKFLTNDEVTTTLDEQLNGSLLDFRPATKANKYVQITNVSGQKARRFQLENVEYTSVEIPEDDSDVIVRFTAEVPYELTFKQGLVKQFASSKDDQETLLNNGSVLAENLNLDKVVETKGLFKFIQAKGTMFEKNKKPGKINVKFLKE